jgi:hypothetical protein
VVGSATRKRLLFREVNERIREVQDSFGVTDEYELLCECAQTGCLSRVVVPAAVFEEAAARTQEFVVALEHLADSDRVVSTGPAYAVVQRPGNPASV